MGTTTDVAPKKRGRPRKSSVLQGPSEGEIQHSKLDNLSSPNQKTKQTDKPDSDLANGQDPERRKRGRPRKSTTVSSTPRSDAKSPIIREDHSISQESDSRNACDIQDGPSVSVRAESLPQPMSLTFDDDLEDLTILEDPVTNTASHLNKSPLHDHLMATPSIEAAFPFLRAIVLEKLARRHETKEQIMSGPLAQSVETIYNLLNRTIKFGEGNNMVIWGPPGCGKTTVIERAMRLLQKDVSAHLSKVDYTLVKLDGVVHSTDRIALRDIARQLDSSVFVSMDSNEQEDTAEPSDDILKPMAITSTSGTWGSFAETFEKILRLLSVRDSNQSQDSSLKPIIFRLENIELFAEHPRQSLLYTLFDLAQTGGGPVVQTQTGMDELSSGVQAQKSRARIPIAVIGTTCRIDFIDLLEKRVKSRFSHRIHKILPFANIEDLISMLLVQICVTPTDVSDMGSQLAPDGASSSKLCQEWSQACTALISSASFKEILEDLFEQDKSIARFMRLMRIFFATQKISNLTTGRLKDIIASERTNRSSLIRTLPWSSFLLLIAIKHLIVRGYDIFNFEMVYDEYLAFAKISGESKSQDIAQNPSKDKRASLNVRGLSRQSAMHAFEQLLLTETILVADSSTLETSNAPLAQFPQIGGNTKQNPEFRMCRALIEPYELEKAVSGMSMPSQFSDWAKGVALAR